LQAHSVGFVGNLRHRGHSAQRSARPHDKVWRILDMARHLVFLALLAQLTSGSSINQELREAGRSHASPIAKVLELLSDMEEKVKREGAEADEAHEKSVHHCERRGDDLGYAIKTGTNAKDELQARISKSETKIETLSESIQESLESIEANEADLAKATEMREKEKKNFETSEKELLDTMDSLKRAVGVLEKESHGSAALLQVKQAPDVLAALNLMVSGAMIGAADESSLTAFLQSSEEATEMQAPKPPAYESKSGGVIEMLEDLQDKAKSELRELRKKEEEARHNYQMVRQALELEIKASKDEIDKMKGHLGNAEKNKADDSKDFQETSSQLEADTQELKDLKQECHRKAEDYELETKSRKDELEALDVAKTALKEKTGGADSQQYSFLQMTESTETIGAGEDNTEVIQYLRDVAKRTNSTGVALLTRRIGNMLRSDLTSGEDVFAKIKDMIKEMIATMEKDMAEAADKKAYCDAEMSKADAKKQSKESDVSEIKTKIDAVASKSAGLKAEVEELQKALSSLAETEATMNSDRTAEKKAFEKNEPELQDGLEGVKIALNVLTEFYKGSGGEEAAASRGNKGAAQAGAATGIIGMLEVVEADFAKSLAEMRVTEKTAAADYEKEMKEMKEEKMRKSMDAKYKTQEFERLDSDLEELKSDEESAQTELSAVLEFIEGLKAECVAKPETFEEKAAKKQKEIDGLESALEALEARGASLVQKGKTSALRLLRGSHAAEILGF